MTAFLFPGRCRLSIAAVVLVGLGSLLGGCMVDPVRWRVRDPAAVALIRAAPPRGAQPAEEILPADRVPRAALLRYTRREQRGLQAVLAPCLEGPADPAPAFLRAAGPPYACQASAEAQRLPDGGLSLTLDGRSQPLLRADGTFPVPLWGQQYDPTSGEAAVHVGSPAYGFRPPPPARPYFQNDLDLMMVTPRANLVEAVRVQRPLHLLGWMLVGMAGAWLLAGVGTMAAGQAAQQDGTMAVAVGASCIGVSIVFTGLGAAVLARPAGDVPLVPPDAR